MFCTKCGKELPEDGSPCACQVPAETAEPTAAPEAATYETPEAAPAPESEQAPVYAPPAQSAYAMPPNAMPITPVHTAIRTLASSPLFMWAVIALTASVLFSIVNTFFASAFDWSHYLPEELRYLIYSYGYNLSADAMPFNPSVFFQLIVVIGPWLVFFAAKNHNRPVMGTGGLTLIRVLQTIALVAMCLLGVACLLITVLMVIAGVSEFDMYGSVVAGLLAFALIVAVAVIVFYIVYLAKIIGSIKTVKLALMTGMVGRKMSMFVVVVNFLIAAYLLVDLYGVFAMGNIWQGVSSLFSAAAYVLFSLCIIQYNKMVKSFMAPPVAYQPPYQP